MRGRREKVFGPGRAVPLDRNAKARIAAYARACTASTVNRTAAHQAGDAAGSVGWGSFKIRAKTGHKAWRGRLGQCPGRFTFMDYLLDPLSY